MEIFLHGARSWCGDQACIQHVTAGARRYIGSAPRSADISTLRCGQFALRKLPLDLACHACIIHECGELMTDILIISLSSYVLYLYI